MSGGQALEVPTQLSTGSHDPTDGRQTVDAGDSMSGGQSTAIPEQVSAASQRSAAARHSIPASANPFGGHACPVQTSARSQTPSLGRQRTPAQSGSAQSASPSQSSSIPLVHEVSGPSSVQRHSRPRHANEPVRPLPPSQTPVFGASRHPPSPMQIPAPHSESGQVHGPASGTDRQNPSGPHWNPASEQVPFDSQRNSTPSGSCAHWQPPSPRAARSATAGATDRIVRRGCSCTERPGARGSSRSRPRARGSFRFPSG